MLRPRVCANMTINNVLSSGFIQVHEILAHSCANSCYLNIFRRIYPKKTLLRRYVGEIGSILAAYTLLHMSYEQGK